MRANQLYRAVGAALCLSLLVLLLPAQRNFVTAATKGKRPLTRAPQIRILRDKPTVYVSFERVGKRKPLLNGESDEGIWLRLHNNTKWAILLDMNDPPSAIYGDADLFYEVLLKGKVIIDARCHVCSVDKLPAGKSLLFSAPREYLDNGQVLRLSFNYEWEVDHDGSISLEPEHYVYFDSSTLPEDIKQ